MAERKKKKNKTRLLWQKCKHFIKLTFLVRYYLIFLTIQLVVVYFKLSSEYTWFYWGIALLPHLVGYIVFHVLSVYWGYTEYLKSKKNKKIAPVRSELSQSVGATDADSDNNTFSTATSVSTHFNANDSRESSSALENETESSEENLFQHVENNIQENQSVEVDPQVSLHAPSHINGRERETSGLRVVHSAEYISEMEHNRQQDRIIPNLRHNNSYDNIFGENNLLTRERQHLAIQRRENSRLRLLRTEKRKQKKEHRRQRKLADKFYLISISLLLNLVSISMILFCVRVDGSQLKILSLYIVIPIIVYLIFQGVFNIIFWSFVLKISPFVLQLAGNLFFSGALCTFLILLTIKTDGLVKYSYIIPALPLLLLEGTAVIYCFYFLVSSFISKEPSLQNGRLRSYSFIPLSLGHTKRDKIYCKRLKVRGRIDSGVCIVVQIPIIVFAALLLYYIEAGKAYSHNLILHFLPIFSPLFLTFVILTIYFFARNKIVKKFVKSKNRQSDRQQNGQVREISEHEMDEESISQFITVLHNIFQNQSVESHQTDLVSYLRNVQNEQFPTTNFSMTRGVSMEELDRLPLHEYKDKGDNITCRICLQDYVQSEKVRYLPCFHNFHSECIDTWLLSNKTCPLCKIHVSQSISMTDGQLVDSNNENNENGGLVVEDVETVKPV